MNNKGFLGIFDGILAIILIFSVFMIFNLVASIPDDSPSATTHDFKQSQDIMEQLSSKVNITDKSFLESISDVLKTNKNSKRSIQMVSQMCKEKFKNLGLDKNYYFTETNHLNGGEIISSGNIKAADNITTASRTYDDYCFVLYVW